MSTAEELPPPVIDAAAVMHEVRAGLASSTVGSMKLPDAAHWTEIFAQVALAEQRAAVGAALPNFGRYRGLKRLLARSVARVALYFLQLIAVPQREYNAALVKAVRQLSRGERDQQATLQKLFARVEQLERQLERRTEELVGLQQRLAELPQSGTTIVARSGLREHLSPHRTWTRDRAHS